MAEHDQETGEVVETPQARGGFDESQISQLLAPLSRLAVKDREQAGRKLSYIEAWHAIAEANRIFGFSEWNRETVEMRPVCEAERQSSTSTPGARARWNVGYVAKVRVTVNANGVRVVREGTGFGSGIDLDLGRAHESASKEAESDAMKRALMTFGNPFGLALYDKEQAGVEEAPVRQAVRIVAKAPAEPVDDQLLPVAQQKAADGWDALRGWYMGLTDEDRLTLRPAIKELQEAARLADDQRRLGGRLNGEVS